MLKLENINKNYYVANMTVKALKNINLAFRENEFVSVLGPSGSGKTTLLNLIGGLDKYSSGNLIINGRETKSFKEKDWNVYRNHRVGFIFQSYNLIPHQTVLSNVELALTIAGLSKEERIKKAKDALDKVGLSDQYYKRPNQLSGGQSQRVAIARAIVNDPEILLADEPTGALDTVTSKQIMNLVKEIAKDRLVIMVTHNPLLAKEYSTRIINLLDGEVLDDSNPYTSKTKLTKEPKKETERAKMTWWTTFKLSILNLLSKSNRTILTSIASSIGIIGISLVLSLSFGVQQYIKKTQEDMLSGNPITITQNALNLEMMMSGQSYYEKIKITKEAGYVNVDKMVEMIARRSKDTNDMFVENDITSDYIDYLLEMPKEDVAAIFLDYEIDVTNNIYFDILSKEGEETTNMSISVLRNIYTEILKENEDTKSYANLIANFTNIIAQAPNNEEYILEQYNVLTGDIARNKDEIMLVLNKDSLISDLTLAQLGYYTIEEFYNKVIIALDDDKEDLKLERFSYEEILNKEFVWYPNDVVFEKEVDEENDKTTFNYHPYGKDLTFDKDDVIRFKITGILEPKDTLNYGSLRSGFYYTEALTNYIMDVNKDSLIVNYLTDNEMDAFTRESMFVDNTINYKFSYYSFEEEELKEDVVGYVGNTDQLSNMMSSMIGSSFMTYTLTKRDLGGEELASKISVYPLDLKHKKNVIKYLDEWNKEDALDKPHITYTDTLSIIFSMINDIIRFITIALVGFTSLALFVSSVMIAIITYVSVMERVKEIGVIRSLGGSKKDVSNLFVAETVIIGLTSGIFAIAFTYLASFIINIFVYKALSANIAVFPWHYALIMVTISITLTLISGFIPSRSAAKKDPVVALRTE